MAGSHLRAPAPRPIPIGRGASVFSCTPCVGCDDARVIEYGGGINNGPAGQVGGGGGGGTPDLGTPVDFFGNAGNLLNDAVGFISSQPIEVLVAAFFVILISLAVLRRAF
jgi:hypothetical protein